MKRKLWIILALAVLIAALGVGVSMAEAGLGFVTQPTVGAFDPEELTYPVTWSCGHKERIWSISAYW